MSFRRILITRVPSLLSFVTLHHHHQPPLTDNRNFQTDKRCGPGNAIDSFHSRSPAPEQRNARSGQGGTGHRPGCRRRCVCVCVCECVAPTRNHRTHRRLSLGFLALQAFPLVHSYFAAAAASSKNAPPSHTIVTCYGKSFRIIHALSYETDARRHTHTNTHTHRWAILS